MSKFRGPIFVTLILVISLAIADAVLAPAPISRSPDFVATVLASKATVAAVRIAIVFASLFVALSIVALIARRQWLTRVGPVEVEEVAGLDAERGGLEGRLADAYEAVAELEERVAYTQQLIDRKEK